MNPFDQETKADGLYLTPSSIVFLENTAKWARFLAVIGFILCGLMVLGSFFMFAAGAAISGRSYGYYSRGNPFDDFSPAIVGIMYLFMAVLYFFPVLYLNNFARRMLNALTANSQTMLESSFEGLRNHYRFVGILTIIVISLYALIFMVMMFGLMAGGMR